MGRRVFTESLRNEAVDLVVSQGFSIAQACEAMGVGGTALRRWVQRWRNDQTVLQGDGSRLSADQQRIRALERQVATLQSERDLLKKSVAFFVKETDRSWK
jgi:transposase